MTRSRLSALLIVSLAACTQAKVIREGKGWREIEGKDATVIEMMTDDPGVLADIAKSAPDARVRTEALLRVKDSAVLADMVRKEQDASVRRTITARLVDEKVLRDLSQNDPDDVVKQFAANRLDMLRTIDSKH